MASSATHIARNRHGGGWASPGEQASRLDSFPSNFPDTTGRGGRRELCPRDHALVAPASMSYPEADVMSRSKEWLVPLLHEHLLSSLRRARAQIEAGDIEGKAVSIERASAIVMELLGSLDAEKGGEIAGHLGSLYGFFAGEILTASRTLDAARLNRLLVMISELHATWVAAAEGLAPRGRGGSTGYRARLA